MSRLDAPKVGLVGRRKYKFDVSCGNMNMDGKHNDYHADICL